MATKLRGIKTMTQDKAPKTKTLMILYNLGTKDRSLLKKINDIG
jgi:hypothetical protein